MLIKEKIFGNVQHEATLCRSKLDQSIMLLVASSTIIYAWFENEISDVPLLAGFRFWVGVILMIIIMVSYLDTGMKKILLRTMNKIPFIALPAMITNLYLKGLEPYYTMFFFMTYASLAFLITSPKAIQAYVIMFSIGVIAVLIEVKEGQLNEALILFTFIAVSILIWIIGTEFTKNHKRLDTELNRVLQLEYLNSHRLKAHVARIIGLNSLIEIGEPRAEKLLNDEIKSMEIELHHVQEVINKPQSLAQLPKFSPRNLSPIEYTLILAEVIFMVNIYILK
jgi:hypothetical protein